jgi:hypothetical protein
LKERKEPPEALLSKNSELSTLLLLLLKLDKKSNEQIFKKQFFPLGVDAETMLLVEKVPWIEANGQED